MPLRIHVGCCGWSYFRRSDFPSTDFPAGESTLQSYARLFDCVEINSTFYRLPREETAARWFKEARRVNRRFEFTIKAYQGITHLHRFRGQISRQQFNAVMAIARQLKTPLILFQSPASFQPTPQNESALRRFFENVERDAMVCIWEPRGRWLERPDHLAKLCAELDLVHCVDPLRNEPLAFGKAHIAYFRLHGFGKPSMYRYDFSDEELRKVGTVIDALKKQVKDVYVFFNNSNCYSNALDFRREIVRSKYRQ